MLKLLRSAGDLVRAGSGLRRQAEHLRASVRHSAATVTATSKFARLGKALVVPFTQERLADGSGYRMVIHPPLEGFPGETEEADCIRINQWVESALRACPEQYLWAHRRFKSRPPGEPKLYAKRGDDPSPKHHECGDEPAERSQV